MSQSPRRRSTTRLDGLFGEDSTDGIDNDNDGIIDEDGATLPFKITMAPQLPDGVADTGFANDLSFYIDDALFQGTIESDPGGDRRGNIPEPASVALLIVGLTAVAERQRGAVEASCEPEPWLSSDGRGIGHRPVSSSAGRAGLRRLPSPGRPLT